MNSAAPPYADRLVDALADLTAGETMAHARSIDWSLQVESVPGSYRVTIAVEGRPVVSVDDDWLARGLQRAHESLDGWLREREIALLQAARNVQRH